MAINVRTIDANNSHLAYNRNVNAGEKIVELARTGSTLYNQTVAIAVISAYLAANPDAKITSVTTAELALNHGTRILLQNAITAVVKKPLKTRDAAEQIVAAHLPGLIPSNTP